MNMKLVGLNIKIYKFANVAFALTNSLLMAFLLRTYYTLLVALEKVVKYNIGNSLALIQIARIF